MRKAIRRQTQRNIFFAGLMLFLTCSCRENIVMFSSFDLRSTFTKFQPVLAVRNTACINCHGKADNLITDFGKGTEDFFNRFTSGSENIAEAWTTAFYKTVTVPVVPAPPSAGGVNNDYTGLVAQSLCETGRHQEFYFQLVGDSSGAKVASLEAGKEYYIRSVFTDQYLTSANMRMTLTSLKTAWYTKWKLEGDDVDGYQIRNALYYDQTAGKYLSSADFNGCAAVGGKDAWQPMIGANCDSSKMSQRFHFESSASHSAFQIKPVINTAHNYCLEIPGGDYTEPEKPIREFISKRTKVKNPDVSVNVLKNDPFIGAPSRAQLVSYLHFGANDDWYFSKSESDSPELNQRPTLQPNSDSFRISGDLTCDGDLAFKKPLVIKNLKVHTKRGCRIYVAGPVFVEGPIEYSSLLPNEDKTNLQIVSSDLIFMGIGDTHCETGGAFSSYYLMDQKTPASAPVSPLKYRLTDRVQDLRSKDIPSRMSSATDVAAYYQNLKNIVQESGLQDASCRPGSTNAQKRALDFDRLMLVAPSIQSRYLGDFKGVIVGEHVLLTLSEFSFEFSPVFLMPDVALLPLIPSDSYLHVRE